MLGAHFLLLQRKGWLNYHLAFLQFPALDLPAVFRENNLPLQEQGGEGVVSFDLPSLLFVLCFPLVSGVGELAL